MGKVFVDDQPWIEAAEKRSLLHPEHSFQRGEGERSCLQGHQWNLGV